MNPLAFTIAQEQNVDTRYLADLPLPDILALLNEHDARVPLAIRGVLPQVEEAVRLIVGQMKSGGRLFYVGAGTSGRLGVLDSAECPPTFGTDPNLVQSVIAGGLDAMLRAVENVEDDGAAAVAELRARGLSQRDVVLGIAASGRTPFVMSALDFARQTGAKTNALTTRGPGLISEKADVAVAPDVGAEALAGSTRMKSGSAQKMLLGMISTATMIQLGRVHGNLMIDVKASNEKLLRRAEHMVAQICEVDNATAQMQLQQVNYNVRAAVLSNLLGLSPDAALAMAAQPFVALKDQLLSGATHGQ